MMMLGNWCAARGVEGYLMSDALPIIAKAALVTKLLRGFGTASPYVSIHGLCLFELWEVGEYIGAIGRSWECASKIGP